MSNHIIQYSERYSLCLGCGSCELMCGLLHDGVAGPHRGRIQLRLDDYEKLHHRIFSCEQCSDHPCYDACPKKEQAMCIDADTGIVYINEEACIGCGLCSRACKLTPSRIVINKTERKAKKCDLCRGVEGGPICVRQCPVVCLGLSDAPLPYTVNENGEVLVK